MVAQVASSLLADGPSTAPGIDTRLEQAFAEAGARIQLCHAPAPRPGESALPLRMSGMSGWLYLDRNGVWSKEDADRVQRALSDLIALAHSRARMSETSTETEAARRSEVAKTAVMHAIAHDLRPPLTAITTAVGALREPGIGEGDRVELTSALATEAERLEHMVADLLDLSRIEAGAANPCAEWCDLNEMVARAAGHVQAQHEAAPIRIDLPAGLPPVHADPAQLDRAFTALLENAVKFSSSDKPVEVRGVCANGRITIRVMDHGRGIPPAEQAHVFKPFARGSDPRRGSGLGLAICRGFVEANGGRIALQSGGREGSAFAVSFPAAPQPSAVN
jgi:two-component system sensor histidine kinase KdpD